MARGLRRLVLALTISLAACGNGTVIVIVNTGVILAAPQCRGSGGQFQLREQGGLVVLVVITSNTRIIVAGGGTGTCSDLFADTPVQVSGHQSGDHLVASSVTVQ